MILFFGIINFLAGWSHYTCWTADPGFVKEHHFKTNTTEDHENLETVPICKICKALKIEGVHHCSTCGGCIYQMDHHCVWVGNCLGRGTSKYFFLFTLYSFLSTFFGWIYFIYMKFYFPEKSKLDHLSLNIAKHVVYLYPAPLRIALGQLLCPEYFSYETLFLYP